ncbi:NACHT family NTPase, partial [Reticulomyxa filosa]
NIPHWNENDTKCIMRAKDGLLLVLDGFDEIVNELNTKPGLQKWLKDCALNTNYSIIMTSRPNAMCSYLDDTLRRLSVIGFKKQDIQKYVYAYFRNITNDVNNNQANTLIKTLNNNQNLQLLSHTPLYLRLFCYLARQEIHELNEINEMKEEKKGNEIEDKIFNGLNN